MIILVNHGLAKQPIGNVGPAASGTAAATRKHPSEPPRPSGGCGGGGGEVP